MDSSKPGIFYQPRTIRRILAILHLACAGLFLSDLIFHRHVVDPIEEIVGFYGLYGFIACVGLVLAAKEMRKMLLRDENYYDTDNHDKGNDA